MKHTTYLLLLSSLLGPLSVLSAQSVAEKRAYVRLGAAWSQNDLKAYLGDRAFSPIYEVGYDFNGPTETTGIGLYVSYLTAHGDNIERYGGLRQRLFGWRVGSDLRFRTPIKGFTPFVGFSVNWYDGQRAEGGTVPDIDNFQNVWVLGPGNWPEGKAKLGMRVGAEYRITESWGISIDASVSNWYSKTTSSPTHPSITGPRHYKGINPVAPSWINFAVQYRWSLS